MRWGGAFDIDRKRIDLQNEEEKTQEPDFWEHAAQAREQLRRVAAIKSWIDDYDAIAKEVEDLELMTYPPILSLRCLRFCPATA